MPVRSAACSPDLHCIYLTVDTVRSKLPSYVTLAVAAALATQVWGVAWPLVRPGRSAEHPSAAAALAPPVRRLDIAQVIAAHLFGQTEADPNKVSATALSWSLVGTYADIDPSGGMAVINDGSAQHLYRVGEEMTGGAILREVYAKRIVFERDNRYEELAFPESTLAESDAPSIHAVQSMPVQGEEDLPGAQEEASAAEPAAEPEAAAPEGDAQER